MPEEPDVVTALMRETPAGVATVISPSELARNIKVAGFNGSEKKSRLSARSHVVRGPGLLPIENAKPEANVRRPLAVRLQNDRMRIGFLKKIK